MEVSHTGDPLPIAPGDEVSTTGRPAAPHHTPNSTPTITNPKFPMEKGQELTSHPNSNDKSNTAPSLQHSPPSAMTQTWATKVAQAPTQGPRTSFTHSPNPISPNLGCLLRKIPTQGRVGGSLVFVDSKGLECTDDSPLNSLTTSLKVGDYVHFTSNMIMDRLYHGVRTYHVLGKASQEEVKACPSEHLPTCTGTVFSTREDIVTVCTPHSSHTLQFKWTDLQSPPSPGQTIHFTPSFTHDCLGVTSPRLQHLPDTSNHAARLNFLASPETYISRRNLRGLTALTREAYEMIGTTYGPNAHPFLPSVATGLPFGGHPGIMRDIARKTKLSQIKIHLEHVEQVLEGQSNKGKPDDSTPHCLFEVPPDRLALWISRLERWARAVQRSGDRRQLSLLYPVHHKSTVGNILNTHSSKLLTRATFPSVCRVVLLPPLPTHGYEQSLRRMSVERLQRYALVTIDTAMSPENYPAILEHTTPTTPLPHKDLLDRIRLDREQRTLQLAFRHHDIHGKQILASLKDDPNVQVSVLPLFSPTTTYDRSLVTFPSKAELNRFMEANRESRCPVLCAPAAQLYLSRRVLTLEVNKAWDPRSIHRLTAAEWIFPVTDTLFRFRSRAGSPDLVVRALRVANPLGRKLSLYTLRTDFDERWTLNPRHKSLQAFTPPRVKPDFAGKSPTTLQDMQSSSPPEGTFIGQGFPAGTAPNLAKNLLLSVLPSEPNIWLASARPLRLAFKVHTEELRTFVALHRLLPLSPGLTLTFGPASPCSPAEDPSGLPREEVSIPTTPAIDLLKAAQSTGGDKAHKKQLRRIARIFAEDTPGSKGKSTQPRKGKGKRSATRPAFVPSRLLPLSTVEEKSDMPSDHNRPTSSRPSHAPSTVQGPHKQPESKSTDPPGSGERQPRGVPRFGSRPDALTPAPLHPNTPPPTQDPADDDEWGTSGLGGDQPSADDDEWGALDQGGDKPSAIHAALPPPDLPEGPPDEDAQMRPATSLLCKRSRRSHSPPVMGKRLPSQPSIRGFLHQQ